MIRFLQINFTGRCQESRQIYGSLAQIYCSKALYYFLMQRDNIRNNWEKPC